MKFSINVLLCLILIFLIYYLMTNNCFLNNYKKIKTNFNLILLYV